SGTFVPGGVSGWSFTRVRSGRRGHAPDELYEALERRGPSRRRACRGAGPLRRGFCVPQTDAPAFAASGQGTGGLNQRSVQHHVTGRPQDQSTEQQQRKPHVLSLPNRRDGLSHLLCPTLPPIRHVGRMARRPCGRKATQRLPAAIVELSSCQLLECGYGGLCRGAPIVSPARREESDEPL